MRRKILLTALMPMVLLFAGGCETTPLADLGGLFGSGPLNESTVASGLKEALRVGTQRASGTLSKPGGFSNNTLLRLTMPEELDTLAKSLRAVGLGSQVDKLEAKMNAAAEEAAAEAVPVFASAIRSMTVRDAFDILEGEKDAATQYFRAKTSDRLRERFAPVVNKSMTQVGLYHVYQDVVKRYEALPFAKPVAPDLEAYVTEKSLDGLFKTLAEEEAKIRADPAARTTELLRRVFGR